MKIPALALVGTMFVFAASIQAKANSLVAVITAVNQDSIQVTTKNGATQSVRLTDKTNYTKWINHKPLGEDSRANKTSLRPGRCISVELGKDDPTVAKSMMISFEEPGTFWYPCRW